MIERLESRRLLAVTAVITDQKLVITGDNEANRVSVGKTDAGIIVRSGDATIGTFSPTAFNGIRVSLLGGADRIEIAQTIDKPSTISGGTGNDSLNGGGGKD